MSSVTWMPCMGCGRPVPAPLEEAKDEGARWWHDDCYEAEYGEVGPKEPPETPGHDPDYPDCDTPTACVCPNQ